MFEFDYAGVLKAMAENGDVSQVLSDILADGVIDDAELAIFTREVRQVRNAWLEVENTVSKLRG